jgi:CBS domain containing-hemolysin-like protein
MFGPFLRWVNNIANRLVRASGVEPVESAAVGGRDIATIRQLVEHSANVGTLEPQLQKQITGLIDLGTLQVDTLVMGAPVNVTPEATVADVHAAALLSGHMRILMLGAKGTAPTVVHVRDTLLLPATLPACETARPAFRLESKMPVYEALARMRGASVQLAVVMNGEVIVGIVTLADILKHVLPAGIAVVQTPISAGAA